MPRFPDVSPTCATLSDRVYSALAARAALRPTPAIPLHVGDVYRAPIAGARAEDQRAADHEGLHRYAPVQGEPVLLAAIRDRIALRSGVRLDLDAIQVTSGATVGVQLACQAMLDPGDELVVLAPFWPLIRGAAASKGARAVEVPFFTSLGEPGFDPERAIEEAITPRTTAIYVNTPHNPTGVVLGDDVLAAIARIARKHDLWVLFDEAYEELYFGATTPPPTWWRSDLRDRAIVAHTASKSYGLSGARVGWLHGPPEIIPALRGAQTFTTYCAPRPMQLAAAHALREGDAFLRESRALFETAARRVARALGLPAPPAGTFVFFDAAPFLRSGETTSDPFLERCLEAGVLLTPGISCGADYARWVRLCFTCVPPETVDRAIELLRPVVER